MARKTLIVGLGTTGTSVCNNVIERLEWEYGSLDRTPWIKFVAVETAGVTNQPVHRTHNAVPMTVHRNEELVSVLQNPSRWEDQFQPGAWVHPGIQQAVVNIAGDGAGNLRQVGRLALLYPKHYQAVTGAIHNRLTELAGLTPARAQADFDGSPDDPARPLRRRLQWEPAFSLNDQGVDIYVVGTLCGGTASGTFIDAPYIIRTLSAYQAADKTIGIFAGYPPNGRFAEYGANTATALREYHHWCTEGVTFRARYDRRPVESDRRPYDEFHLVTPASEGKDDLDRLNGAIGDYIYVRTFSPDADRVEAKRADFGNGYNTVAPNGQQQNLATFGISGIEYPARRFVEACQLKLIDSAMDRWLKGLRSEDELRTGLVAVVQQELSGLGLLGESLVGRLLASADGAGGVQDRMHDHIHNRAQNCHGDLADLEECEAQLEIALGVQTPGTVQAAPNLPYNCIRDTVDTNRKQLRDQVRLDLATRLRALFVQPDYGPTYCRAWVRAAEDHLATELKRYQPDPQSGRTGMQVQADTEKEMKDGVAWDLDQAAHHDLLLKLLWGRGWAIRILSDDWASTACQYYDLRVAVLQQDAMLEILKLAYEDLRRYGTRLAPDAYAVRYVETCRDTIHSRLEDAIRRPHLTNYEVLLPVTRENVDFQYQAAFTDPTEPIDAWKDHEKRAQVDTILAFERLAEAVFATPDTSEEVVRLLPRADQRWTDAHIEMSHDDSQRLLEKSRSNFSDIEREHILSRLQSQGGNVGGQLVGSMLSRSRPMLGLRVGDGTRFENLAQKRAAFIFFNGQRTLDSANPPADVRTFAALLPRNQDPGETMEARESVEQHRITVFREQTAFPLGIVEGMLPNEAYGTYLRHAPGRATYFSRSDVRAWYPLEIPVSSTANDPNHPDTVVRWFLILIALERINSSATRLVLQVTARAEPVEFPRSLRQIQIEFAQDPASGDLVDGQRDAAVRAAMFNAVLEERRKGVDDFVLALDKFVRHAGQAGLEAQEGVDLDEARTRGWLLPYIYADDELRLRWEQIPGNAPPQFNPAALFRAEGQDIPGGKAQADGHYCDQCGFRFGKSEADVRTAKSCVRCKKIFVYEARVARR